MFHVREFGEDEAADWIEAHRSSYAHAVFEGLEAEEPEAQSGEAEG